MDKQQIIHLLSQKVRLIRAEYKFSQDKMANILGLSKKTLVEIEKGRKKLSWTASVALCAIFRESEILQIALGENPIEIVETIALNNLETPKNKTLGGKIWWKNLQQSGNFRLQQNIISEHYRILDHLNHRWYSSLNKNFIEEKFNALTEQDNKDG